MRSVTCLVAITAAFHQAAGQIFVDTSGNTTVETTPSPTLSPTLEVEADGAVNADTDQFMCVNPNDSSDTGVVSRLGRTTVCLTVGPGGNWNSNINYLRYTFRPKADEYSTYHIPNSYTRMVQNGDIDFGNGNPWANISVFASSSSGISFLRHYYEQETERIFPHLTAIIDLNDGEVEGIAWDDACVFCGRKSCVENTYDFNGNQRSELKEPTKGCFMTKTECDEIISANPTSRQCDLSLFVVWTGDDKSGNVMSSSSSRFSAFAPQHIEDAWKEKLDDVDIKTPDVPGLS